MDVILREKAAKTKRVSLYYHSYSGSFTLTYPKGLSQKKRQMYLARWKAWMEECLRQNPPADFSQGSRVSLFGSDYLVREFPSGKKQSLQIEPQELHLFGSFPKEARKRRETVEKLLRPILLEKAQAAAAHYGELLGEAVPTIHLRAMRSRWGSCFPAKGKIHLSVYLIYKDTTFLHEVVLHEIAHFQHPNHQKGFKELVKRYKIN